MDHGIEETAQERIDAGKKSQGEIILSASHTSSEVVISVSDDGYGMSPGKLLAKAREKGLLTKPESEYSRKEALGLIRLFHEPGCYRILRPRRGNGCGKEKCGIRRRYHLHFQ